MAFSATTEWDVRSTGSDANGGGFDTATAGTDRSQQNSAQIAYTDLAIDATTNTKVTSSAHPFTSAEVGNIINITGGTGFTVQRVQVVSVVANVATCDKSLGTLSSTGGTGNLGGALATLPTTFPLAVSGNTIHIKNATYTITASLGIAVASLAARGFATTHGDGGTRPLITTATNSVDLFQQTSNTGTVMLDNLSLSNTASTRLAGIQKLTNHDTTGWLIIRNCVFDGFTYAANGDNAGAHFDWTNVLMVGTEIKNSTVGAVKFNTPTNLDIWGCYFHDTAAGVSSAFTISGFNRLSIAFSVLNNIGVGSTSGSHINGTASPIYLLNCTLANASGDLVFGSTSAGYIIPINCIFYGAGSGSGGYAINGRASQAVLTASALVGRNNAFGNNATADRNFFNACPGDLSLSASPFTSSSDFTLNSTAGGGAACSGAGFPGAFGGASFTGAPDLGAVQTTPVTTDYPVVGNVRSGTAYALGALTGTLALPVVGNVIAGVTYGAGGTEFTGTAASGAMIRARQFTGF